MELLSEESNYKFEEGQKLIITYENALYKAEVIKSYAEIFLVYLNLSLANLNKKIQFISNGTFLKYSIDMGTEIHSYSSKVIGVKRDERSLVLVINNPQVQNKIERRNHVRVPIDIDVEYTIIPNQSTPKQLELIFNKIQSSMNLITCKSIEISAGGMSMFTSYGYKPGALTIMNLQLHDSIYLLGKVVRSEALKTFNFRTAIQFINLPEEKQNIINNFVVDRINKGNV